MPLLRPYPIPYNPPARIVASSQRTYPQSGPCPDGLPARDDYPIAYVAESNWRPIPDDDPQAHVMNRQSPVNGEHRAPANPVLRSPPRAAQPTRRSTLLTLALYAVSMSLVGSIVAVALAWCRLSMLHVLQGPFLLSLWSTHGIHVMDIVVVAIELMLVLLLSVTLIAGFSRGR